MADVWELRRSLQLRGQMPNWYSGSHMDRAWTTVRWCAITTNCQEKLTTRRLRRVFLHRSQKSQTSISVSDVVVASFARDIARRAPITSIQICYTVLSRLHVVACGGSVTRQGGGRLRANAASFERMGPGIDSTGFVNQRMCD